jgi:hypothetical protein
MEKEEVKSRILGKKQKKIKRKSRKGREGEKKDC